MDKSQVRSCLSASGSITYDPLTGIIGGGGGGGVTPAALTKTDDTNVTLTLGGTPATALLQATSLTLGWSGQLAIARGGTGLGTLGTALQQLRVNAGGTALEYFTPTSSSGLTVGTTPIASGTVGRILFEGTGNVLQQSANVFWDNTNSRLSLGIGSSPAARLDVLSPGTSSTDLAIRVRNNGNTINLLEQRGNGDISLRSNANNYNCNLHFYGFAGTNSWHLTNGTSFSNGTGYAVLSDACNIYAQSTRIIQMGIGSGSGYAHWNQVVFGSAARQKFTLGNSAVSSFTFYFENTNFGIGVFTGSTTEFGTNATNTFAIKNGVAPTTGIAGGDGFQMYSADIVAGNAAPHIRTENGNIIKLYRETTAVGSATFASPGAGTNIKTDDTFGGYTLQKIVQALINQGLLA